MRVFKDPAGKYLERWDLLRLYVAIGSAASASTGRRVQECVRTIADRASQGCRPESEPIRASNFVRFAAASSVIVSRATPSCLLEPTG